MNTRVLWAAALAGGVHATFSLYWALGGRVLLETVGPWAVTLADTRPIAAGVGLTAVGVLKLAAAAVPLMLVSGRLPAPGTWRIVCRAGAGLMVLYGGVNAAVAWLVLSGVVTSSGGYDRDAMLGHAALWDPLFLLWGVLLLLGLRAHHTPGRIKSQVGANPGRPTIRTPHHASGEVREQRNPRASLLPQCDQAML